LILDETPTLEVTADDKTVEQNFAIDPTMGFGFTFKSFIGMIGIVF
jgi:hypothetical protein